MRLRHHCAQGVPWVGETRRGAARGGRSAGRGGARFELGRGQASAHGLGILRAIHAGVELAQRAEGVADVGMVAAHGRFADAQRAQVERFGLGQISLPLMERGMEGAAPVHLAQVTPAAAAVLEEARVVHGPSVGYGYHEPAEPAAAP